MTGASAERRNLLGRVRIAGGLTAGESVRTLPTKYDAEEAITPREALRSYTIDSAYVIGQDHVRGSPEVGKLADFSVLDRDLLGIPSDELLEVTVLETYVDGVRVYAADDDTGTDSAAR